jgi:hypothetical protein
MRSKVLLVAACLVMGAAHAESQTIIEEGFDNVPALFAAGWARPNRSEPLGTVVWSQCSGTVIPPAHSGTANSCIFVDFDSTGNNGTISNWLLTPAVTLANNTTLRFFTRTATSSTFPDRLQVRMSTSGASTNVGTSSTDVGDFTTLLLEINPNQTVGGYPTVWTQFSATITGLAVPANGRVAFRYFVTDAGFLGNNSDIIGVDTTRLLGDLIFEDGFQAD